VQEMLVDASPPRPPPQGPLGGWVLATAVLVAARISRLSSEADRFNLSTFQVATCTLESNPHEPAN
jgi:hypothetical protein